MSTNGRVVVSTRRVFAFAEDLQYGDLEAPSVPRRISPPNQILQDRKSSYSSHSSSSSSNSSNNGKSTIDDEKHRLVKVQGESYDDYQDAVKTRKPSIKELTRESSERQPVASTEKEARRLKDDKEGHFHLERGQFASTVKKVLCHSRDDEKGVISMEGSHDEKGVPIAEDFYDEELDDLIRPPSLVANRRLPLFPGAFPTGGIEQGDDGTLIYDSTSDQITDAAPYHVNARLVDEDREVASTILSSFDGKVSIGSYLDDSIAVAEVADMRKNRCVVRGLILALALAILVSLSVGVMTLKRRNETGTTVNVLGPMSAPPSNLPSAVPSSSPSTSPSSKPTLIPWSLAQELNGGASNEFFGYSVELSDDGLTLAVGAPLENAGIVRVYRLISGSWTAIGQELKSSVVVTAFGKGLALSGDGSTVAICGNGGEEPPFVEIYRFNSTAWSTIGRLTFVGYGGTQESVALSRNGRILAIGSPSNSTVRVFERINVTNNWAPLGSDINGRLSSDEFGQSVDLSTDGLTVLAGAPGINDTVAGGELGEVGTPQTGYARAYSYSYDNDEWTLFGTDNMQGLAPGDQTGWSVAISGDGQTAAVGAILNDVSGENAGTVRVFKFNTDNLSWLPYGRTIPGETALDNSGWSLDMSTDGSTVVIGAPGNKGRPQDDDNPINYNAGHARVYKYLEESDLWIQVGADIDGELARDNSGADVAISSDGSVVVVGAPYNNGDAQRDAGHVRVYYAPSVVR